MTRIYDGLTYTFNQEKFGRKLKAWRTRNNYSLHDVYMMLGGTYTAHYLGILEQGISTGGVPIRTFLMVCNLIDMSPHLFFEMVEKENADNV